MFRASLRHEASQLRVGSGLNQSSGKLKLDLCTQLYSIPFEMDVPCVPKNPIPV